MKLSIKISTLIVLCTIAQIFAAKFGQAPAGWGDIKFGLVSNGIPYREDNELSYDTRRLKIATEALGIQIDYRYRYVNEGVDPSKNACVNLFNWQWDADYSKHAQRDAGVESSYVIYALQEEGGRVKLLANMADPLKMQQFFHTLITVAEHANGYGATIVVEPDTWGYLLQDHYQNKEIMSIETDPLLIPAVVNNIESITVRDSFYVVPDPTKPWKKEVDFNERVIDFDYLSDLPNNMAGFGRAMIRTLHRYAPDCYVGFLASHWSVNLGLDGNGWSSDGMVWASPELLDTSAKINIEFFEKFYFGSISEESPLLPGDSPDFIGVEKNGWCAGLYETKKGGIMSWYWSDQHMKNYLQWVKQIGQGLDLPVLGWQISIGNMDNPNLEDYPNMANAYKDTFFPYFFNHVDEFVDAGFIGFLVGKGLSQGTDYTLPDEGIGENGWFFNQLIEFDKGRPYLDTNQVSISSEGTSSIATRSKQSVSISSVANGYALNFSNSLSRGSAGTVELYNLRGQLIKSVNITVQNGLVIKTDDLAQGALLMVINVNNESFVKRITTM